MGKEEIRLKYGEQQISFAVDGAKSIGYLYENPMQEIADIEAEFLRCVTDGVTGGAPLGSVVSKNDQITVVISDMTRFWMRQDILCSLLVRYLNETLGIPFENIVVLVALGTHRLNTPEEKKKLAGEYAYAHVQVIDHDCDAEDLALAGVTSLGTEVWVNPLVLGRKVICISGTVHHIMAGYGGGRKSIVPGVSSRHTVKLNHERALDPQNPRSDPRIGAGVLTHNPIHEDMEEAAKLVPVVFGISIVVNSASRHSGLFCGDFDEAWRASCRYVQQSYGLPIEKEGDIVIASCGGFPKDINLYQSTKTLFNAAQAVKKGGTLILLAECREGGGSSDFFDWNTPLKEGRLDEALRNDFTIGGYIFYAACETMRKARTLLLGKIDPNEVRAMGIEPFTDMEDLLSQVDFTDKEVYVIPYGGSVMPQLEERYAFLCGDV